MMSVGPCVYFVEGVGTNKIKIGITTNINSRLSSLRCNSPCELNLVYVFSGYISKEKEIHKKFKHLRVKGEWFEYTDEIKQYILELSSTIDTNITKKIEVKKRNRKTNYGKAVTTRISLSAYMMLEELSKEEGLNIAALMREAVNEYLINKLVT